MRVLITGGCGFVGRHFVRALAAQDHAIAVVDNLSSGLPPDRWLYPAKGKVQYHFADMRQFIRGLDPAEFDLVIHCAAVVGGRLTIENDPLLVATDLSIDAELFNWIVRGRRKPHLIYFSSSAVYPLELQGENCHCALAEGLVTFTNRRLGMPDMTYGFAKLAGEYLAGFAEAQYYLPVTIYRPFSGYGEDQDSVYPMPAIVKRALDGENPLIIWGSGNQTRDWIHIDDIVEAVLATYEKQGTWNLGSGIGVSFFELAELIGETLAIDFDIRPDITRPEGVHHRVSDPYQLISVWHPKIGLAAGIRRVADALLTQAGKRSM